MGSTAILTHKFQSIKQIKSKFCTLNLFKTKFGTEISLPQNMFVLILLGYSMR
jgi:hypothetical protein